MTQLICRVARGGEHNLKPDGALLCNHPLVYRYASDEAPDNYRVKCVRCRNIRARELAQAANLVPAQGQLWKDTRLHKKFAGREVEVEMVLDGYVYYQTTRLAGGRSKNIPVSSRVRQEEFLRVMVYLGQVENFKV